ncbi:ABC transporter ATP-binding protein [Alicyclobacillus fastidiosus]|uniref:ABC transporter ATP-binding protein n=1 Tax=Alicyclobacillus fastidiosus TaxID=392011 RepID=A0ABV5AGQ0_9BACL|nr:ABC transporter ATP-binding protein [Alicyclobacillus fastidiosus]WEH09012.1 ABC transporter ATP-binding protein [Alicyclobacillus fastidiosus]
MRMASRAVLQGTNDLMPEVDGIVVDRLSVSYRKNAVLKDISLRVKRGEAITLLGNSGCGKTTLLRAIAGFVSPSSGCIQMAQRDITKVPPHRRDIGFLHQQYALFPHLTVEQNVCFGLRERRIPKDVAKAKADRVLSMVRLEGARAKYPSELSGGMQQRVALARCLVLEPKVLLLDEPLSALDANLRVELRQELKEMRRRFPEMTMIYVTHDRDEAMTFSDQIAMMRDDVIEQFGHPSDLYDHPTSEFVARFLGDLNEVPTEITQRLTQRQGNSSQVGKWYIRPERIVLSEELDITLPGTVKAVEWSGGAHRVEVALAKGEGPTMTVSSTRLREEPYVGKQVAISFSLEDCMHVPCK